MTKTILLSGGLGALASALGATAAFAGSYDASPLINEAISDILVPVGIAIAPVVAAVLVMPLRRFLDQRSGDLLASRVNDLLDKGIAYGAQQGQSWVTEKDFHVNVDGWVANVAADYAVSHAPGLMKQAGALASAKAGDAAKQAADDLLKQKIVARLVGHPAVVALKASAPPAAAAAVA